MARKRYLKPGFFSNEDLAELAFEYRLVFQGLWLWADRDGRIEDRPKRLKSNIMPYDNVDFDQALQALAEAGFIIRYKTQVNGNDFKAIQIINFSKHQDVHVKEQASTIPAPVLHRASTVLVHAFTGTSPSLNLVLDTCTLNLEPELVVDDEGRKRENEIDEAIKDYTEIDQNSNASFDPQQAHLPNEKEKSSAKKEKKPLPEFDEVIIALSSHEYWRIAMEHNLPPGIKWDKLVAAQKKVYEDQRLEDFKIFWEQQLDRYKIRLDSWAAMSKHFYNWVPIHRSKHKLRELNGAAINKSKVHTTGSTKANATNDRIGRNDSIADIVNKSQEFLQQHNGIDTA